MSVVAVESNRLAAPVELLPMPPSSLISEQLESAVSVEERPSLPEFVVAAREFAARHSESAAAETRLAQAEQAVGHYDAAVEAARRALELMRREADPAVALAAIQVLIGCERVELAIDAIGHLPASAVRSVLEARLAIQTGEWEHALELLDGVSTRESLMAQGWLLLELRRFPEAVHVLRRALSSGEPSATLLANLGYAHAALGARQKALRETKQARELSPASELIGLNIVAYYMADRRTDDALHELARLRVYHPSKLKFDL